MLYCNIVKIKLNNFILIILTFLLASNTCFSEEKRIIASIKPLHSIILNVVKDEEVDLLLGGALSPHDYMLKPSDMKKLQNADLVFYIDDSALETFLSRPLRTLDKEVRKISLASKQNLTLLPIREGGIWEKEDDGHDHSHGKNDLHIWLDSENAIKITKHIVRELSRINPANKSVYKRNAQAFIERIKANRVKTKKKLEAIKDSSFIVFHDAYQYYDKEYNLNAAGSISLNPEISPTPQRINEIKLKIKKDAVECVFREPQFSSKIVQTIINDTNAKEGLLDPLGSDLKPGKDLYLKLINKLTEGLTDCLS
jgi:zinc transport system substrate-binding protein